MRKVDDGEEKKKKEKKEKKEKIMTFIVATNVIASRPPERRPTGTLEQEWTLLISMKPVRYISYLICNTFQDTPCFLILLKTKVSL